MILIVRFSVSWWALSGSIHNSSTEKFTPRQRKNHLILEKRGINLPPLGTSEMLLSTFYPWNLRQKDK
jgi:hypothetical protein